MPLAASGLDRRAGHPADRRKGQSQARFSRLDATLAAVPCQTIQVVPIINRWPPWMPGTPRSSSDPTLAARQERCCRG